MTGTNHWGCPSAVASAALTCAAVAPDCSSAVVRVVGSVIRDPSIPTDTMGAWTVRSAPLAPRMAALVGHETFVTTESPPPSWGMIDRGDHFTNQFPEASLNCSCVGTCQGPKAVSMRLLVIVAVA